MTNTMNNTTFGFATLGTVTPIARTWRESFPIGSTTWVRDQRVTVIGHALDDDFPCPVQVAFDDGRVGLYKVTELGLTAESAKRWLAAMKKAA
jgi:hypothetical protein